MPDTSNQTICRTRVQDGQVWQDPGRRALGSQEVGSLKTGDMLALHRLNQELQSSSPTYAECHARFQPFRGGGTGCLSNARRELVRRPWHLNLNNLFQAELFFSASSAARLTGLLIHA